MKAELKLTNIIWVTVERGGAGAGGKKRKPVLRGIPNTEGWKQDDKEGNET